jgi:hypothetical protein
LYETTKIPILAKRIQYKALPYLDANYSRVINTAGHWHKHKRYTDEREQRARSYLCVYSHDKVLRMYTGVRVVFIIDGSGKI